MLIVPVTPVGSGLTPGEVISVEPSGIPVGEPAEPVATPSGEVAPTVGVGVTVPSNCPSTCAIATLQTKSAGRIAATSDNFIDVRGLKAALPATLCRGLARRVSIGFATISPGARRSDIDQSPK
jgi:hypothetical protein